MAESVWEKGRIEEVLHPVGKRENGEARYRNANFSVLRWKAPGGSLEELWVLPNGMIDRLSGGELNLQEEQLGLECGYLSLARHIVEPFQADGREDSWKSLHGFGYV